MERVLPSPFLFRWAFPVRYCAELPAVLGQLDNWAAVAVLPLSGDLDGTAATFASVSVAWNESGLAVAVRVTGKRKPLHTDIQLPTRSDGFDVWIDTRGTQNVHRATRFCHRFSVLARGVGRKDAKPVVMALPFANAKETVSAKTPAACPVYADVRDDGYDLAVWFPGDALFGYDPEANPRLGFYIAVRDAELGEQFLTVGREFPIDFDPSLWQTVELRKSEG